MNFPSLGGSAGAAWAGLSGDVNNAGSKLGQPFQGGGSNTFNAFDSAAGQVGARFNSGILNTGRRAVGNAFYNSVDPQFSMNSQGTSLRNPSAALRAGLWGAAAVGTMGASEYLGGGDIGGLTMMDLGANTYSRFGTWAQNHANRENASATQTKNADVAAGGVNGLSGTVLGAATSTDVSNQLAVMAAQQMQAQQMYEGMIMQQLSMFSTLGGQGASQGMNMAMMGA